MARIEGNDLTLGLRGKFGKQFVFRKYRSRTIAARKPEGTGSSTQRQAEHRERFRLAAHYAKRALLNPELKAEYEAIADAADHGSAFAAALSDFIKPVSITDMLTTSYNGEAGFSLTIRVSNVLKVKTMKVTFTDVNGNIVEHGEAVHLGGSVHYSYITTVAVPVIAGLQIKVEVMDRPGNTAVLEVML